MLVGVAILPPSLRNIGILHYKKAKLPKHLQHSVHIVHNDQYLWRKIVKGMTEKKQIDHRAYSILHDY